MAIKLLQHGAFGEVKRRELVIFAVETKEVATIFEVERRKLIVVANKLFQVFILGKI